MLQPSSARNLTPHLLDSETGWVFGEPRRWRLWRPETPPPPDSRITDPSRKQETLHGRRRPVRIWGLLGDTLDLLQLSRGFPGVAEAPGASLRLLPRRRRSLFATPPL